MAQATMPALPQVSPVSPVAGAAPVEPAAARGGGESDKGPAFAAVLEKQLSGTGTAASPDPATLPAAAALAPADQEDAAVGPGAEQALDPALAAMLPELAALPLAPANPNARAVGLPQGDGEALPASSMVAGEYDAGGTGLAAAAIRPASAAGAERLQGAGGAPAVVAAAADAPADSAAALAEGSAPAPVESGSGTHTPSLPAESARPGERASLLARIDTPVGAARWAEDFSQKVSILVGRDQGRAELILNPPQLGRVEVSIDVSGDTATAQFVAASPVAREAIEQALPRLRETLAQAGVSLGQTSVSAESNPRDPGQAGHGHGGRDGSERAPLLAAAAAPRLVARGLVDTFA
jgi:flagellar hook-length control protein FliK